jgi:hypothetical protein
MTEKTELEALKERADMLGITYHPNIGLDKLKEKVNSTIESIEIDSETEIPNDISNIPVIQETQIQMQNRLRKEAAKLIRIRVTCMNPSKKEWKGEVITAANSIIPEISKYVPFGIDEGWHVPMIIYNAMKERMYTQHYTTKIDGKVVHKQRQAKEFAIEVLPALSIQELQALASDQARRNAIEA